MAAWYDLPFDPHALKFLVSGADRPTAVKNWGRLLGRAPGSFLIEPCIATAKPVETPVQSNVSCFHSTLTSRRTQYLD